MLYNQCWLLYFTDFSLCFL
ncbi:hypothetical protein RDI58_021891 [Solanum bulbocastanum]|uniref:Uncharacterized protein n=1 Tax=Solanum bulbocastanum TaxID=147425 RepID=A0AAN8T6A7_SOLBU